MNRRRPTSSLLVALAGAIVLVVTQTSVRAAPPCVINCRTPQPSTPTPYPTYTPPAPDPSGSPTPGPISSGLPLPSPTPLPTATPPLGTATPLPTDGDLTDALPPGLESSFEVPHIARTRPRNTAKLVKMLEPLTESGMPLEQVLVEGMGRFPVAGLAYYFDDWLNPRYTPYPHLHHGLDIFADFGTPIRSPDRGVITSISDSPAGGVGTWMRSADGTSFYFAHQLARVEGLHVGQRVDIGTVLGFIGDTGNAQGGTPHLHFEIHRPDTIPPKPTVDTWLDEAEELAPRYVEARLGDLQGRQGVVTGFAPDGTSTKAESDLDASMLLTLLDPVGGSVGLLPQLKLEPTRRSPFSDRILAELIRLRLDGYLLAPSQGAHVRD